MVRDSMNGIPDMHQEHHVVHASPPLTHCQALPHYPTPEAHSQTCTAMWHHAHTHHLISVYLQILCWHACRTPHLLVVVVV